MFTSFWQRHWERMTFWSILLLGAGLRVWRLDQNGYGTEYYSAAVRSMMSSWHNFLYNSFDPAGFVSLDKPPMAIWVQVVSAKLFGFRGLAYSFLRFWKDWPPWDWFIIWYVVDLAHQPGCWPPSFWRLPR